MEHAVSDRLIDRIDAFLEHPQTDPHGDPIPKADGTIDTSRGVSLADCQVGQRHRLARVLDQTPEFLRYLSQTGLRPGVHGEVLARRTEAGVISVRVGELETTLGCEAAEKLLIN